MLAWILLDTLLDRVVGGGKSRGEPDSREWSQNVQGGLAGGPGFINLSLLLMYSCRNWEGETDFVWKCFLKPSPNGSKCGVGSNYQMQWGSTL